MTKIVRMSRLFIALELPDKLKTALLRESPPLPRSRPVPRERLHLTLRFLGNTPAEMTERLVEYIQNEFHLAAPILLVPDGIGFFPNLRRASSMHLRLELTPELQELKECLDNDLQRLTGIQTEKNFKAHITLRRIKFPPSSADLERISTWETRLGLPETEATRLTLFHSHHEAGHLLHTPLASCSAAQ